MKDRIKKIRKSIPEYGRTQESFAKFLGIPKPNLASYETGRRTPSDAVVQLICEKCNIRKEWLINGTGEMDMLENPDDRYAVNIGKLQRTDNETIMRWVNTIAETSPETLEKIEEFMKKLIGIE